MKLFSAPQAPNPRRVVMVMAEKGITDIDVINVDLMKGDNLSAEFRARNPLCKVPVLELDDGTCISESAAIIRYLESLYPQPPLLGSMPAEKAIIDMWDRRLENSFMQPVGFCFQHGTGFFKDRMNVVPAWGEESMLQAQKFLPPAGAAITAASLYCRRTFFGGRYYGALYAGICPRNQTAGG